MEEKLDIPQNGLQADFLATAIKELKAAQEHINHVKNLTQSANSGGADIESEDVLSWFEDMDHAIEWAIKDANERLGVYEEAA